MLTRWRALVATGAITLGFGLGSSALGAEQAGERGSAERGSEQRPRSQTSALGEWVRERLRDERRQERKQRQRAEERKQRAKRDVVAGVPLETLNAIAACESGGDPKAVSADGTYRGKYQFDHGTWAGVGGEGDPAQASEAEQDRRAAMLYSRSGSNPWPVCGS